mmetsp:Transcript_4265/g.12251  ORF Transcript_4265/g.12251 Transcript_4265/m.12251 type:complete len:219 (+) Transcript_4265:1098-1754(+)
MLASIRASPESPAVIIQRWSSMRCILPNEECSMHTRMQEDMGTDDDGKAGCCPSLPSSWLDSSLAPSLAPTPALGIIITRIAPTVDPRSDASRPYSTCANRPSSVKVVISRSYATPSLRKVTRRRAWAALANRKLPFGSEDHTISDKTDQSESESEKEIETVVIHRRRVVLPVRIIETGDDGDGDGDGEDAFGSDLLGCSIAFSCSRNTNVVLQSLDQ